MTISVVAMCMFVQLHKNDDACPRNYALFLM